MDLSTYHYQFEFAIDCLLFCNNIKGICTPLSYKHYLLEALKKSGRKILTNFSLLRVLST